MATKFTTPYDKDWDFHWTLDRYHLAIENGSLNKSHKVELIYGRVWDKYPPSERAEDDHEYRWPFDHYQRIVSTETITNEDNLELLAGRIAERSERYREDDSCLTQLANFISTRIGKDWSCHQNYPIKMRMLNSEPRPDFLVANSKDISTNTPETPLIIEIASSFLAKDRTIKRSLYAEANLAEYWIINLVNRQIEVHLHPEPEQKLYGSVVHYKEADTFTSPFAGEVVVAELLPDKED